MEVPVPALKAVLFFFSAIPCIQESKEPAFLKKNCYYCQYYYPDLPTVWPYFETFAWVDDQFALFQGCRTR